MLSLSPNTQIYLATEAVDMRRSFDGLSALVMDVLAQDPLSGHLFVFSNRLGDKIKILYYDGQGLCQWYKRLERGRFRIPTSELEGVELTSQELGLLLDGLDIGLAEKIPKRRIRAVM